MYRGVRHILFRPGRRSDRGRPHQLVATADADVGMLLSHNPSPWGCRRRTTTSSSSVRVDGRIPGWPPPTTCWASSPSFPSTRRMSRPPTCSPSSRHSGVPRQDARVIRSEDREPVDEAVLHCADRQRRARPKPELRQHLPLGGRGLDSHPLNPWWASACCPAARRRCSRDPRGTAVKEPGRRSFGGGARVLYLSLIQLPRS
jgi:hypothetical protein